MPGPEGLRSFVLTHCRRMDYMNLHPGCGWAGGPKAGTESSNSEVPGHVIVMLGPLPRNVALAQKSAPALEWSGGPAPSVLLPASHRQLGPAQSPRRITSGSLRAMKTVLSRWRRRHRHDDAMVRVPIIRGLYRVPEAGGRVRETPAAAERTRSYAEVVRTRRIEIVNDKGRVVFSISPNRDGEGLALSDARGMTITIGPVAPGEALEGSGH